MDNTFLLFLQRIAWKLKVFWNSLIMRAWVEHFPHLCCHLTIWCSWGNISITRPFACWTNALKLQGAYDGMSRIVAYSYPLAQADKIAKLHLHFWWQNTLWQLCYVYCYNLCFTLKGSLIILCCFLGGAMFFGVRHNF